MIESKSRGQNETREPRRAALFRAAVLTASIIGGMQLVFAARHAAESPTLPFDADARYGPLRAALAGVREAGFTSDSVRDPERAKAVLYGAQYALAPTVLIPEGDVAALTRKLTQGYVVVCDFADTELLRTMLDELERLMAAEGVSMLVARAGDGVVCVRTKGS